MKIKEIKVSNFRLLENFSVEIEDDLSLVIGKNNTGKTSFLTVLDKFINGNKASFAFDDFNLQLQEKMEKKIKEDIASGVKRSEEVEDSQITYKDFVIELKLYFAYLPEDSSKNYSKLIMDLDPKNNIYVLSFDYSISLSNYLKLIEDYKRVQEQNPKESIIDFLNKNHTHYFNIYKYVLEYDNEENKRSIEDKDIKKIINLQIISAKREVANSDTNKNAPKTLSKLSHEYFDSKKSQEVTNVTALQQQLKETDEKLSNEYKVVFDDVYDSFKKFAYEDDKPIIEIISNLQETNLLEKNTLVRYNQNGHNLPEDYNGLGYLNLFAIIFNIHLKLDEFKKKDMEKEEPADINLLFVEEPEAHTHPQMQYVFIKNIKSMLKDLSEKENEEGEQEKILNLQTVISTHSSHIVSQSDFNDIRYFYNENDFSVKVKNLSELEAQYVKKKNRPGQGETPEEREEKQKFQFLKRYLTLNNAELFFASKAIFIEGATERILIPAFLKKVDKEETTKLLSQNISIVEVGSYAHVFDKFIEFLGIKTLVITDIDSIDGNKEACRVTEGVDTSNSSIKHFLSKPFEEVKSLSYDGKQVNNHLRIAYQIEENGYHARSFEDAFISVNFDFIKTCKDKFESLKCRAILDIDPPDFYEIADNCVDKKSVFAVDILYYSSEDYTNWVIPEYIKEGLKWLAK